MNECDLQVLIRKLNEIDKRTRDTEQALKVLGRALINGEIGSGTKQGYQEAAFGGLVAGAGRLAQQLGPVLGPMIAERLKDPLVNAVRNSLNLPNPEDFKRLTTELKEARTTAGINGLIGIREIVRENRDTTNRIQKQVDGLQQTIKRLEDTHIVKTSKNVNDMWAAIKVLSPIIRETRKFGNDTFAAILALSPVIRRTRELANDSFAALKTFSPLIRETRKLANDAAAGIVSVSNRVSEVRKFSNDILAAVNTLSARLTETRRLANDALAGIQVVSRKIDRLDSPDWPVIIGAALLRVAPQFRAQLNFGGDIAATRDWLATLIRAEHISTRQSIGGQITANTTVLMNRVAYTESWLTNKIEAARAQLSSQIFSNTAGIPAQVGTITNLQALATRDHITKGLLALLDQIIEELKKSGADKRVIAYLEANHKLAGYEAYCTVSSEGVATYRTQAANPEAFIKSIGAGLFTAQPRNPDNPSEGNLPVGSIAVGSPLSAVLSIMALTYYRQGLHQLPASVPERIHYKQGGNNPAPQQVSLGSLVEFQSWQFKQIDSGLGMWPLTLKHKLANGETQTIEVENLAEAVSELVGLAIVNDNDTDNILGMIVRLAGDLAQTKGMLSLAVDYLDAQSDYLGYKYSEEEKDMPLQFDPSKTSLDGLMKPSNVKVKSHVLKESDDVDLKVQINKITVAVTMLSAAFLRRFPKTGGAPLEGEEMAKSFRSQEDDFEQFILWLRNKYGASGSVTDNSGLSRVEVKDKTVNLKAEKRPQAQEP